MTFGALRRRLLLAPLLALTLVAGCTSARGGSSPGPDAASLVPGDALAFVTVDTDLSSTQLERAQASLDDLRVAKRNGRHVQPLVNANILEQRVTVDGAPWTGQVHARVQH